MRHSAAADLIKPAMIAVHDQRVLAVLASELDLVKANVTVLMTNVEKLDVPLIAEPGVGIKWEKAH